MSKKIFRSVFTVALVVLLASIGIATTFLYDYFNSSQINQLKAELSLVADTVNEEGIEYFLTGFSGGVRYQPVVRYNKIHCYVNPKDISRIIEHLECKKVDSGANLVFIVPYDECVLMNSRIINNSSIVSAIQAFLDCMNLKGRGEELAEEILVREIDTYER